MGFVKDPEELAGYSQYGFRGQGTPFTEKTDKNLIIGLFGGSFAEHVVSYGREALFHELEQSPDFADKEIILHALALGGYKQPQQLLGLTYFLLSSSLQDQDHESIEI